jgi:hypothetical protein
MATYRTLSDIYIGGGVILAGSTLSTQDVGGSLPTNWVPPGAVDPLDTPAVNAFYAAGVQPPPLVRQQWSTIPVSLPVTYWRRTGNGYFWQLTGPLGSSYAPISAVIGLP